AVPRAVTGLLRWARDEYPRWSLGQRIELGAESADPIPVSPDPDSTVGRRDAWETTDPDLTVLEDGALSLWAARWTEVHATLAQTQAEILAKAATVEVVRDGEHRSALWDGLRSARRRVVLADDRIGARTAKSSLVRQIKDCRDAGASV